MLLGRLGLNGKPRRRHGRHLLQSRLEHIYMTLSGWEIGKAGFSIWHSATFDILCHRWDQHAVPVLVTATPRDSGESWTLLVPVGFEFLQYGGEVLRVSLEGVVTIRHNLKFGAWNK